MARITEYRRIQGSLARRRPTVTIAEWEVTQTPDGEFLKLSTLGSADRESRPKASQVIHFDRESARQLVTIFEEVFGE